MTGNLIAILLAGALVGYLLFSFIRAGRRSSRPASSHTKVLTDSNFREVIRKGVTLVDFWAAWCQPCRIQGPVIDEVADEVGDKVNICKMNIDENRKTAGMLGIRSIPTIMIFNNGKPVKTLVGLRPKTVLLKAISEYVRL
ncbi:MAG: thioredoxin [Bacteroidales bacterium]|nr:thioredoxin [Bacteroidales bacterium]